MVDPTSDLNENVPESEAPSCLTCDEVLTNSADHRVVTWIEDGEVQTAHFCDDGCRSEWDGNA